MVLRLVKDWILRKTKFINQLIELLLGLALSELLDDRAYEVSEQVIVIDFIVLQEVDHVQLLWQTVRLEEMGVEGNEAVNDLYPSRK